jgi:long-subunit fatty acid transport protein
MRRIVKTVVVVGMFLTQVLHTERPVYAGGFAIDEQGAAAMGRANAFSAQADDPSALFYNPAGIGQLEGTEISVGTTFIVKFFFNETKIKNSVSQFFNGFPVFSSPLSCFFFDLLQFV